MPREMTQLRKHWDFFDQNPAARFMVSYGGAGSGKSRSVGQRFVLNLLEGMNERMLVTRKTLPSLRITAYRLVLDLLKEAGFPLNQETWNKSEMLIRWKTNEILFKGLDDPEKIKSYEATQIWVEEATEITREDFLQLNLRLRLPSRVGNHLYLTFNPVDQYHWLITDLVHGKKGGSAVLHSTHLDNPFLDDEYRRELEALKEIDENYYRIYALGEPGVLKNIIYTNYMTEARAAWPDKFHDVFYGLDFGFNNPSALVKVGVRDRELYLEEAIYEAKLTNSDLIQRMKDLGIDHEVPIYADSAEPARIEEIVQAGFNVMPAQKSVRDGIDQVKRHRLHLHPESVNLLGEIRGYKYREDKTGRVLEDPVKWRDHLMDAMRYAIHTHLGGLQDEGETVWTLPPIRRR